MEEKETVNQPVSNDKKEDFSPKGVSAGSEAHYDLSIELNSADTFTIDATISVKNKSTDVWNDLLFYFIPNMFTRENSPHLGHPAIVNINRITVNNHNVTAFTLEKDTLTIPLSEELLPANEVIVAISYEFTLPEEGLRLTQNKDHSFLAQWYPMIATYREHQWNKEAFRVKGETYHTSFSDFTVRYAVPKELTVISSSDDDTYPSDSTGTLSGTNIKEFFIALLKSPTMMENKLGDTSIRVFGVDERTEFQKEISEIAFEAFAYFEKIIGPYPHKQLDIILAELGMEYPGIVTAYSIYNQGSVNHDSIKRIVVHEIAHQWFYGVVSNDPYHDAWLDEALTEIAENLFFVHQGNELFMQDDFFTRFTLPVNLPLHRYTLEEQSTYVYGKAFDKMWRLFEEHGGTKTAEEFLKAYYEAYQYSEVNTKEFIRFLRFYLDLPDNHYFTDWLSLD